MCPIAASPSPAFRQNSHLRFVWCEKENGEYACHWQVISHTLEGLQQPVIAARRCLGARPAPPRPAAVVFPAPTADVQVARPARTSPAFHILITFFFARCSVLTSTSIHWGPADMLSHMPGQAHLQYAYDAQESDAEHYRHHLSRLVAKLKVTLSPSHLRLVAKKKRNFPTDETRSSVDRGWERVGLGPAQHRVAHVSSSSWWRTRSALADNQPSSRSRLVGSTIV